MKHSSKATIEFPSEKNCKAIFLKFGGLFCEDKNQYVFYPFFIYKPIFWILETYADNFYQRTAA